MKQKILILYMLLLCCTRAAAQSGLNVSPLFQGRIVPKKEMVVVKVRGQAIQKYDLTFYHSLRFLASNSQQKQVQQLVEADLRQAVSSKVSTQRGQQTTILQLPPHDGRNRFLCVVTQDRQITVVYMEGHAENIAKLEKLIRNN